MGVGPTIVIVTATPLVNLVIGACSNRRVARASVIGLVLTLGGVVVARWGGVFQWSGFLWSLFGTIMNGVLYELFSRSQSKPLQKCFWACVGTGVLGMLLSVGALWAPLMQPKLALMVIAFAFVGGFLYWLSNLIAFENLPTNEASIFAQGETPAVIIGASIMLGEHLTPVQWGGVIASLYGAWYLTRNLGKKGDE